MKIIANLSYCLLNIAIVNIYAIYIRLFSVLMIVKIEYKEIDLK